MSLISKMLKDLDKRSEAAGGDRALFADVRRSFYRRSSRTAALAAVAALVVAIAAVALWKRGNRKPDVPAPVPQVVAANAAAPEAPSPPAQENPVPQAASPAAAPRSFPVPIHAARAVPVEPAVRPAPSAPTGAAGTPAVPPAARIEAAAKESGAPPAQPAATAKAGNAELAPAPVAPAKTAAAPASFKVVSPKQRSENLYRQAVAYFQQSRTTDAEQTLKQSLAAWPNNHAARLALASLLVDKGRDAESIALLKEGLNLAPGDGEYSLALARLYAADNRKEAALAVLERALPDAGNDGDYHAFYASLLQGQGRHEEAVRHFITALRTDPMKATWLVGAGVSLQATRQTADAREAYRRALEAGELTPELAKFAQQQLNGLGR